METTARLALPMVQPGQAQKEMTVNESFQALDVLVAAAVEEPPRAAPPSSPGAGACYIVSDEPSGEWAGREGTIAAFTAGGWRYLNPPEGLQAYVKSTGSNATYRGGSWTVSSTIADPVGGAQIDAEARAAIAAILATLRGQGLVAS